LDFEENGFSNYVKNCIVWSNKTQGILGVKFISMNKVCIYSKDHHQHHGTCKFFPKNSNFSYSYMSNHIEDDII
jgi:hypothetical protein